MPNFLGEILKRLSLVFLYPDKTAIFRIQEFEELN